MSMVSSLMGRLHRCFDKNSYRVAALYIGSAQEGTLFSVANLELKIERTGVLEAYSLDCTLQELVDQINLGDLAAAEVYEGYENTGAYALLEDTLRVEIGTNFYIPRSFYWSEMQTYSVYLINQAKRLKYLQKQIYLHSAVSSWLDYWCKNYLAVPRKGSSESDFEYLDRTIFEILSIKVNNVALAALIERYVGFKVRILDLGSGRFFTVNRAYSLTNHAKSVLLSSTDIVMDGFFGVYLQSGNILALTAKQKEVIKTACERFRASGTQPLYFAPTGVIETNNNNTVLNSVGYVVGPSTSGWELVEEI